MTNGIDHNQGNDSKDQPSVQAKSNIKPKTAAKPKSTEGATARSKG